MSKDMPPEITSIRDAVIDHAHRGTPLPENIDELYEWLLIYKIYGRPLDEMTYDFYFHLTSIEFRDEYLRYVEGLDSSVDIDDRMRLAYARKAIEKYLNRYADHLLSPESIRLDNDSGDTTYLCGMAFMAGQGGIEMNWDGCFESREKYIEYLRNEQGMCDSAEIDLISDADILALWEYE